MQWYKRLSRLGGMSGAEILTRARQGFMKRWDYVRPPNSRKMVRDGSTKSSQVAQFFFDPSETSSIVELMRDLMPEQVLHIKERADRICQHRFDLLGYKNIEYGPSIDWHLDVVNGKRSPRKVWFKIPYLNFSEVGDHKVIWELNRHQHLVTLAKAYRLTGDERYVHELCAQWYQWRKDNPYSIGINWCSTLEVGFRTLSWLWILPLLGNCPGLPGEFRSDLLHALALNARHISRYLSTYFSPNTHLIGEAVALFFLGTLCPQIPSASELQEMGWGILLMEAERQIQRDGVHFEQSIYYHVYALDLFLHARILAGRNGWPVPGTFDHKIEQMAEVLSVLGQTGPPPRIGDDDGGRVFDPARNGLAHLLDPLSTAAVLFERSDFKSMSARPCEETLWLLGVDGATRFAKLPMVSPTAKSHAFESGGLYVMPSDNPKAQLVARAGQMGALRAGHSHCDLLSLSLSINGRECLADPGTYRYVSETGERDQFRGTSAHNTVRIDGCDQAKSCDCFSWDFLPTVRVQHWVQGHSFDLFVAEHSGYRRLRMPATHRRWVVYVKPRFWFVRDVIEGEGRHALEMFWHSAPGFNWTTDGASAFLGANDANAECALTLLAEGGHDWSTAIRRGWYSPAYGEKKQSSVLEFSRETELPCEFATGLFPGRATAARLVALAPLGAPDPATNVIGYRFEEPTEDHYLFFAAFPKPWVWQGWASDASFFYGCINSNAELVHLALCNGSFAEINGRRVFSSKHVVGRHEWPGPAGSPQVWCSEQEGTSSTRSGEPLISSTAQRPPSGDE